MRIYTNPRELVREVERDLFEMGIEVHPQTMQDKVVGNDPNYRTKELQAYGFQLNGWEYNEPDEAISVNYVLTGSFDSAPHPDFDPMMKYMDAEFKDRISTTASNPGNSWQHRPNVWEQFLHNGKFAYTYSERMAPQWSRFYGELRQRPDTRQAIINLHSNICPIAGKMTFAGPNATNDVFRSADSFNMGGSGRIPCSLYYQAIRREGKLDWVYAMRSCDFIVHFPVDLFLALRLQRHVAEQLGIKPGRFTYFSGSFHAYAKDLKDRGIF